MAPTQGDLWFWGITIGICALTAYLLPFLMALWIKPTMLLWGFLVGRRRRKAILSAQFPETPNRSNESSAESEPTVSDNSPKVEANALANDAVRAEQLYLDETHRKRLDHLNSKLGSFEQRLSALDNKHAQRKEMDRSGFPGKAYYTSLSFLNKQTAKISYFY